MSSIDKWNWEKVKNLKCLILLNSKPICWINYFIFCSILGNGGPNLVGKGKYKVWMWERGHTKTNLLCLVPYTVVVAPAACGQWDPRLNMAGNSSPSSPSTPPPYLFPSFWGQMAQGTIEKLFCFGKKITRTPGHAQTMLNPSTCPCQLLAVACKNLR